MECVQKGRIENVNLLQLFKEEMKNTINLLPEQGNFILFEV